MRRSVENSISLLGTIDLLQLHQANPQVLCDRQVLRFLDDVTAAHGIQHLGASVKTVEAADLALQIGRFDCLQMPINNTVPQLVEWARTHHDDICIIGNRPFASGNRLAHRSASLQNSRAAVGERGVVLTGTVNPEHLVETAHAWERLSRTASE